MKYRDDHMRVLNVLADELPKRPTFKISEIALKFKGRDGVKDPDRAARNAIRKPRSEGHVEIAERGDYRLTSAGVSFMKDVDKNGYKVADDRAEGGKKAKKSKTLGKKAKAKEKPVAVKATAKVKKVEKKSAKKAAKSAAPRVASGNPSRTTTKKKGEGSNGIRTEAPAEKNEEASLDL
jgi:hypothetical protein